MKTVRRQFSGLRLRKLAHIGVCCANFLVLGCSDRSQQLENRVAVLTQRVEQLQAQLEAAKQGNDQAGKLSKPSRSMPVPTREALESTYEASSKELKNRIAAKLTGFTVENYATHSVQMAENLYPFTSKITFSIRSDDGRTYQMDLPVKADYTGKWIFPDAQEVVARINSAKDMTPITEKEAARHAASRIQRIGQSRPPIMNADGTIVIQWGDSQKPNRPSSKADSTSAQTSNETTEPVAPPTAATQAPSEIKQPVMPVDRDVHIEFTPPPK
jgi:hypothetical protein